MPPHPEIRSAEPAAVLDPYLPPETILAAAPLPEAPIQGVNFGPRLAARAIDLVPHYVSSFVGGILVAVPIVLLASLSGRSADEAIDGLQNSGWLAFLLSLAGSILADAFSEGFAGATLGKRLLGLQVVRTRGRRVSFLPALKRSVAFLWDSLFFGIIAHQKMSETPLRQRYGDHWGDTVVVRRKDLPPASRTSDGRFFLVLLLATFANGLIQAIGYLMVFMP